MNWQDIFENTVVKNTISESTSDKTDFYINQTIGEKLEKKIWVESKELNGGFNIFREWNKIEKPN